MTLNPGSRLGNFEIVCELRAGGMGVGRGALSQPFP